MMPSARVQQRCCENSVIHSLISKILIAHLLSHLARSWGHIWNLKNATEKQCFMLMTALDKGDLGGGGRGSAPETDQVLLFPTHLQHSSFFS